jgi:hypothetical protein
MPYENPYLDTRGKTEAFFRDMWAFDAFSRGSADYAYEVRDVNKALSGFNVGFITDVGDREAFMNIYRQTVVQEQMLYNNLVFQTAQDQRQDNLEAKFYLNALEVEKQRVAKQTAEINKLQADASVERQEDIKRLREERNETIARLTNLRAEEAKAKADKYYLRRDNEQEPSLNLEPQPPLIPQWFPVIPEVIGADPDQALSLKIILLLAVASVIIS